MTSGMTRDALRELVRRQAEEAQILRSENERLRDALERYGALGWRLSAHMGRLRETMETLSREVEQVTVLAPSCGVAAVAYPQEEKESEVKENH